MGRLTHARTLWPAVVYAIWHLLTPHPIFAQSQPARLPPPTPGSIETGRALFVGGQPFANGGPPCISCHSVASLSFPYGGTVGPDLTHVAGKLGAQGLDYAMETLYFPTMTALFRTRPLTPAEQIDLGAFLENENQASAGGGATAALGGAALVGLLVLLAITALAGRGRIGSVRRRRLAQTRGRS